LTVLPALAERDAPRVGFVVIGAQKAGTTALFDHLSDDPRLNLSTVKETHFFDDETVDWSRPDYGAYHAYFDLTRSGPMGEATPIYVFWPDSLERLKAYNPDVRLILMLRDPVKRAFSHWQMEYARGVETLPFAQAIREGRGRLDGKAPNHPDRRVFTYVERGFYGAQLEHLLNLFPREQLLVLRADDLRRDPTEVLARVYPFLGLAAPEGLAAPREVHVARAMDYGSILTQDDVDYLRTLYAADLDRLDVLAGIRF
jgi:hypothetical protein